MGQKRESAREKAEGKKEKTERESREQGESMKRAGRREYSVLCEV
jgi:hypothetical protein